MIGVGVPVSVGVGEIVAVNGRAVSVGVGEDVGLASNVAVGGMAVAVGGFRAAMICGETVIRAAMTVPTTPMIPTRTVGLDKGFFVSSSDLVFLLIRIPCDMKL